MLVTPTGLVSQISRTDAFGESRWRDQHHDVHRLLPATNGHTIGAATAMVVLDQRIERSSKDNLPWQRMCLKAASTYVHRVTEGRSGRYWTRTSDLSRVKAAL
jgi:hypothetical protein